MAAISPTQNTAPQSNIKVVGQTKDASRFLCHAENVRRRQDDYWMFSTVCPPYVETAAEILEEMLQ